MDELVARLAAAAGIDAATAERASGLILTFLDRAGPADAVSHLLDAVPGARDLVNATINSEGSGGVLGAVGGMFGAPQDLTALGGQLMGVGLDLNQMQTIGREIFAFAAEKAGPEVVGRVVGEIPGLAQFV
jgi:hypothetical protein